MRILLTFVIALLAVNLSAEEETRSLVSSAPLDRDEAALGSDGAADESDGVDSDNISDQASSSSESLPNLDGSSAIRLDALELVDRYGGATGEFRFDYPIDLPVIPGCPMPSLAISYSSEASNGILGVGMSLTGLSAIERDTSRAVKFAAGDGFLLDGQKLIQGGDDRWHTQRESFRQIQAYSLDSGFGDDYWVVRDKDGVSSAYGHMATETNSITDGYLKAVGLSDTRARSWSIRSVSDMSNNGWSVDYAEDEADGAQYPITITYGRRDGTVSKRGTVDFCYSTRDDVLCSCNPSYSRTDLILSWIVVRMGGNLARKYHVVYERSPLMGANRIDAIVEYGSDGDAPRRSTGDRRLFDAYTICGTAKPETNIDWKSANVLNALPAAISKADADCLKRVIGDFDGNGLQDLVMITEPSSGLWIEKYFTNPNGTSTKVVQKTKSGDGILNRNALLVGDFDGDQKDDLAFVYFTKAGGVTARVFYTMSSGDMEAYNSTTGWGDNILNNQSPVVGDVNGDGCDDLVFPWYYKSVGLQIRVLLGKPDRSSSFAGVITNSGDGHNIWNNGPGRIADIDGDGRADLIFVWENKVDNIRVKFGKSDGTFGGVTTTGPKTSSLPELGDFNGDGKIDLAYASADGITVLLSTWKGAADFSEQPLFPCAFSRATFDTQRRDVVDANGDGYQDIIIFQLVGDMNSNVYSYSEDFYYSTGDGRTFLHESLPPREKTLFSMGGLSYGDYNADGTIDYFFQRDDTMALEYGTETKPFESVIDRVTTSSHARVSPGFSMSVSLPGVVDSTIASFPLVADKHPQLLMASLSVQGPSMATQSSTISYGKRMLEKGSSPGSTVSLGFSSVTIKDAASGISARRDYYQARDLRSMVSSESLIGSDSIVYQKTDYTYLVRSIATKGDGEGIAFVALRDKLASQRTSPSKSMSIETAYEYDAYGNATAEKMPGLPAIGDEVERHTEWAVNKDGWRMALEREWTLRADQNGTLGLESETRYYYDGSMVAGSIAKGLVTRIEHENDSSDEIERYEYYLDGRRYKYWDWRAASGKFGGDPSETVIYEGDYGAFPATVTDAFGHATSYTYDPLMRRILSMDPNGAVIRSSYDAFGRIAAQALPSDTLDSPTYRCEYNDSASPKYVLTKSKDDSTDGSLLRYAYSDELDRHIGTLGEAEGGAWIVSATVYDGSGRLSRIIRPYYATSSAFPPLAGKVGSTYGYDAAGRMCQETLPDGTTIRTLFGAAQDGAPAVYTIDQNGSISSRVERPSETVLSRYDTLATSGTRSGDIDTSPIYSQITRKISLRKASLADSIGASSVMIYDLLGRKMELKDSTSGTTSWAYSPESTVQTDAKKDTLTVLFDRTGRQIKRFWDGGFVGWMYDEGNHGSGIGRLTSTAYGAGSDSYTYDSRGRVVFATRTLSSPAKTMSKTLLTTFDSQDRPKSRILPDGEVLTYGYDSAGQLASVKSGSKNLCANRKYDARGSVLSWTFSAGSGTSMTVARAYYDESGGADPSSLVSNSGLLRSIKATATTTSGTSALMNLTYAYDKAGNIKQRTDGLSSSRSQAFGYDFLNRLTSASLGSAGNRTYNYDVADKFLNKDGRTYAYESAASYKISDCGICSYAYDANGRPVKKTDSNSKVTTTMEWDAMGGLKKVSHSATAIEEYWYDADGNRVMKKDGAGTTCYFFEDYEEIASPVGTTVVKHYFADGERIAMSDGMAIRAVVADHLGSASLLVDSNGAASRLQTYEPFGEALLVQGAADPEYTFSGKELDDSGMYYFGARYHDPELGRFVTPDPLIPTMDYRTDELSYFSGGLDPYEYCRQNPLRYTDPTGLDAAEFYNNLGKKDANSSSYAYDNALTNSLGSPAYNTSTPSDSPYPSAPARPSDARLDAKVAKNAQSLVGTKYYLGGRLPSNEGGLGVDCSGTALLSGERASGIGLRDRTADEMEKDPNLLREGHGQPGSMNFYDETGDGTYGHVTVVGNNGTEIHPSSNKGTINLVEQGYLDQFFSEKVNREYNWSYVYGY